MYVSQLIEPQRCTADDVLEYALKQIYKSMGAATVARLFESNAQHQKHIRNINDNIDRLLKEKRAANNIEGSSTNDFSVYEDTLYELDIDYYNDCGRKLFYNKQALRYLNDPDCEHQYDGTFPFSHQPQWYQCKVNTCFVLFRNLILFRIFH